MYHIKNLFDYINHHILSGEKLKNFTLLFNSFIDEYHEEIMEELYDYIYFNKEHYNRVVLFKNNNIELTLITWLPNQCTTIHGHTSGGCLFKILKGRFCEYQYENNFYSYLSEFDESKYIDNTMYKHKIINNNITRSISLHIYVK